jgi:hypothetical protein
MRIRRIGYAALASAVALGGIAVGTGAASAAKPSLSGTLTCNVSSTINISPSLVLTIPNKKEATGPPKNKPAKPGKDKAPKFTSTNGQLSSCSGSEPTSGLTPPTGGTSTSKSKGTSRLCAGGPSGGPASITKNKITFSNGAKGKVSSTTSPLGAFNTATQVVTPAPPAGSGIAAATAWVLDHATERLHFTITGTAAGKVYSGKTVTTKVVTTDTLATLFAVKCAGAGISALVLDPAHSRLTVG